MRTKSREKKVPLNLLLTKRTRDQLEQLKTMSGADSLGEVVRRSCAVYELLLREYSRCGVITVYSKDRILDEVNLIP